MLTFSNLHALPSFECRRWVKWWRDIICIRSSPKKAPWITYLSVEDMIILGMEIYLTMDDYKFWGLYQYSEPKWITLVRRNNLLIGRKYPTAQTLQNFGKNLLDPNPGKMKLLFWVLSFLNHFREWFFNRNAYKNKSKNAKIAKVSFIPLYSSHKIFSIIMCCKFPMNFCSKYV